ncbi:putative ORFan [Tupanvirus deep ocean]|uniref:ORFan n=2 Tax=Tupanvirus TaxID=2094720 RepID=A0AC62A9Q4_9VIRU|nr:putative ORFan [Tupanvirus deep ocean]QKU34496.1 putative ORFan [Tupanvirus deep ocean]
MEKTSIKDVETNRIIQESTKNMNSHGFFVYVIIGSLVVTIAILLGNLTNKFVNEVFEKMKITNTRIKIAVQIILTVCIIYIMKQVSPYIHKEPQTSYSYDILFISIYFSSQANLSNLLKYFLND